MMFLIRRLYTTKSFDKLLGLDFPSSRMQNKKYFPSDKAIFIKLNNSSGLQANNPVL